MVLRRQALSRPWVHAPVPYEGWDRTVGGSVAHAGLSGFLSEIKTKAVRATSATATGSLTSRGWAEKFGDDPFTTGQVHEEALRNPKSYEAPAQLEDVSVMGYTDGLVRFIPNGWTVITKD